MHVLYEEDGEFKVGAVLAQAPASFQVESPHGRRTKVKASSILLSFERPGGAELMAQGRAFAETLDTEFLWQCCGSTEFDFQQLAREYVGRDPTSAEAAGILLKIHSAPVYFHRRGRGRYQAASAEMLERALAGLEKKRRTQEKIAEWRASLGRFESPPEIETLREELLYAPDRNKPETKAFEQACEETGLAPARLFERCGLLSDSHDFHLNRFLFEFFPKGTHFPPHEVPPPPADLPLAEVRAFSLDDIGTTEIDDAFSVTRVSEDELRIGVHIAAPALGFGPGSPLDAIARGRLSTAYMPGIKYTMLPGDVIANFSLDAGSERPAFSLYLNVSARDMSLRGHLSRVERVRIVANLRHAEYQTLNETFESGERAGLAYEEELRTLWQLASALEQRRGKPSVNAGMVDFIFRVEEGRVRIEPRRRGSPLDKLVSELMIVANTTWGELLAERDVAAIYRVQSSGKVRMSTYPEAHEGLGVLCYAWMSSPLRRYIDLVNQWQLGASIAGRRPPFSRNSEALLTAMRAYELTHARYDEHQRAMETYWCLRWLLQEKLTSSEAVVLREGVVRLAGLPLTLRIPSMPELEPGTRVRLDVGEVDLVERSVNCAYREVLPGGPVSGVAEAPQVEQKP
ncbi:MAG: RNB domain-containing ribonuclease [Burkholderiales bacterium]